MSPALGKCLTCKICSSVWMLDLGEAPCISTSSTLSRVFRICQGIQQVARLPWPSFLAGSWLVCLPPEAGLSCPLVPGRGLRVSLVFLLLLLSSSSSQSQLGRCAQGLTGRLSVAHPALT